MTAEQQERLEQCRKALGPCIDGRVEMLREFLDQIGLPEPQLVDQNAARFVPALSEWIDAQAIQPEDRGFLILRLAALIGEVLTQRGLGNWSLHEDPTSPHFASYVITTVSGATVVNPFALAADLVREVEVRGQIPAPTRSATAIVTHDGRVPPTLIRVVAEAEIKSFVSLTKRTARG